MVKRKAGDDSELDNKKLRKDEESGSEESGSEVESENEEMKEVDEEEEQKMPKAKQQLSSQDVQIARETAELYKSNVFKLQIDELLKELKLDEGKKKKQLEQSLFAINKALQEMPDSPQYTIDKVNKAVKSAIPFPDPKPATNVNYKFQFQAPTDINVVGSYSLKTAVKQPEGVEIDLYVQMPNSLFTEKDYLNYRYFHKRAFYLACMADQLEAKDIGKVKYAYMKDDALRPVIRIKLENKFSVNVMPGVANGGVFEPRKLGPDRNCVRLNTNGESSEPHDLSTPLYNGSLLSDTLHTTYLKYLHTASKNCEGFQDACKLGRLWLRQRGFASSFKLGGFGHFEFAMVMAVLLQETNTRLLMNGFSSYQLFQGTIRWIATEMRKGLSFAVGETAKLGAKTSEFNLAALCLDSKHMFNVFYKVSGWSLGMLEHEAKITADMLGDVVQGRFDSVFMRDLSIPKIRYDVVFDVEYDSSSAVFLPADKVKYTSYRHFIIEKLYRALKRGYGDRVYQIALFDDELSSFKLGKRKINDHDGKIQVGLICNPDECDKFMTDGPEAEQEEEAQRFQRFWGNKSELRRFQNGRIAECVMWTVSPTKPVVISIAEYLLNLHFSDAKAQLEFGESKQLLEYIPVADLPGIKDASITSNKLFAAKTSSFHKLAQTIQSFRDVPLFAKNVLPASSSLRHSSIHQPLPFDMDGDDAVAKAIIIFESSTRWPDDYVAVEKTKTAFLIKIGEELEKKQYKAIPGVDDDEVSGFLRVQTPEGFDFELRVSTDRDELLMKRLDLDTSDLKKQYTGAYEHSLMMYRLGLRYAYYSPAVRLVKRWVSSQLLLGNNIPEPVIELLVLSLFVDSAPYNPPASPTVAFYRFIDLVSRWNWRDEPVLLVEQDVNRVEEAHARQISLATGLDVHQKLYTDLGSGFSAQRSVDQALTNTLPLYIASAADKSGVLWTTQANKSNAGKAIASRLTALARNIASTFDDAPLVDTWFTPSLDDFEVVVHVVDPLAAASTSEYKNLVASQQSFPPWPQSIDKSVDLFQEFVSSITSRFDNELMVFSGRNCKTRRGKHAVLAAVWKPAVTKKHKFRVNLEFNHKPDSSSSGETVVLNKHAIVDMIKRMGGDMVKSVEFK